MPDAEPRHRDTPDSTLFDSLRFDPISIRDALDAAEALSKAVHVPQPVPSSSAPNAQRPNARSRRPTHLAHTHAGDERTSGRRLAAQRRRLLLILLECARQPAGAARPPARPTRDGASSSSGSRRSERFKGSPQVRPGQAAPRRSHPCCALGAPRVVTYPPYGRSARPVAPCREGRKRRTVSYGIPHARDCVGLGCPRHARAPLRRVWQVCRV